MFFFSSVSSKTENDNKIYYFRLLFRSLAYRPDTNVYTYFTHNSLLSRAHTRKSVHQYIFHSLIRLCECVCMCINFLCRFSGYPNHHRAGRMQRSRSAGGQDSPSPQQSPFRRNAKANQSARQSPTHHRSRASSTTATSKSLQTSPSHVPSTRNYNTWNSSSSSGSSGAGRGNVGGSNGSAGKKKRPAISEDTFCQQVAEIMQQYAAMMPSPRKDSKPDSRVSTRIPAPVPVQRT